MGLPVSLAWGGLSPSYCFVSYNKLGADIVAKITATLAGSFSGFFVGPTASADITLVWIRTDTTSPNWQIEGIYLWDAAHAPNGWTPQQDPLKAFYGDDVGIVNAMAVNYAFDYPPVAGINYRFQLTEGLTIICKAKVTNTLAVTLNPNGLAGTAVKKQDSSGKVDLIAGEIVAGNVYIFVYDGTQFICINPTPVSAGVFVVKDPQTVAGRIGSGTSFTVAHGATLARLGFVRWSLVCASAEGGYSVGDEVDIYNLLEVLTGPDFDMPFSTWADPTNLGYSADNDPNITGYTMMSKNGPTDFGPNMGKWQVQVRYQVLPA